jgi:hypothetical protein
MTVTSRHIETKQEKTWREMAVNFAEEISLSYSVGLFNKPSNLTTWGKRLYFPSEGQLRTFIALKNLSSSAGFELANLGSNASTINTRTRMSTTDGFGRVPLECWDFSAAHSHAHLQGACEHPLSLGTCHTRPWRYLCVTHHRRVVADNFFAQQSNISFLLTTQQPVLRTRHFIGRNCNAAKHTQRQLWSDGMEFCEFVFLMPRIVFY